MKGNVLYLDSSSLPPLGRMRNAEPQAAQWTLVFFFTSLMVLGFGDLSYGVQVSA